MHTRGAQCSHWMKKACRKDDLGLACLHVLKCCMQVSADEMEQKRKRGCVLHYSISGVFNTAESQPLGKGLSGGVPPRSSSEESSSLEEELSPDVVVSDW